MWLRAIQRDAVLETEDQVVFGEFLALLHYKLYRREELGPPDRGAGAGAVLQGSGRPTVPPQGIST